MWPCRFKARGKQKIDNKFLKFFIKTVAWSLIGTKDWQLKPKLFETSLVDNVTSDFPPTYITDGDSFSFGEQGISLDEKIRELNVPVESLFYKDESKEIIHEYQFNYETLEAKECYE